MPSLPLPPPQAHSVHPLPTWLEEFIISRRAMQVTPRTLAFYRYALSDLLAHLSTNGGLLQPSALRGYLVHCGDRSWADTTVHLHARAARTFCRWLYAEGYLTEDVWKRVPMPRLAKRILPALSVSDVKELLAHADTDRDRAIILCLLDTGARAAEFCALTVGDVDMRSGMARIRNGKGGKERMVRIGVKAKKALSRYLKGRSVTPDSPLFESRHHAPFTPSGLFQTLQTIGVSAGVAHCGPHTFRRTFALWSYRQGMSLTDIQMLLGHADLTVIRQYLDLQGRDMEAAHRRFGPVDGLL